MLYIDTLYHHAMQSEQLIKAPITTVSCLQLSPLWHLILVKRPIMQSYSRLGFIMQK